MSKARFNNLSDLLNNINIPVHEIRDAVALANTNSQRITDHENGTDPHPQYYNQARGDSRYIQITTLEQPNGVATLDSNAKIKFNQIPDAALGGLSYQGSWNANTNTPSLFSGQGTRGYFYKVSVQGSTDLDGITDWKIGDWVIFDGAAWQKLDQTEIIQSVNNKTGDVVLDTDDISEGITNLYFTNQRASDAAPVQTVYGRIGVVVAEDGDYSASQVVFDASSSDLVNTRVQSAIVELNTKTNTHINDNGDPHPQYTTTTEAANAAPVQSVDGQTGNVVLNYDNYGGWELRTDGVSRDNIDSGEAVNFVGGSNITLSYSATNNTVTISATNITDTNFYLDGLSFNTADGILTASVNGATDQTVDLDGRYLLSTDKAADSDLLDGLDSTDFYRKRQTLTSSDDLNTITQEGLYGWNASIPTNSPNNQSYCSMFVTNDGSQAIQYVFGTTNGNAWIRRANSGVFGAFIRVYTDSYHPIADALTTERQIALSGDVSGLANFDGSANITINATVADDSHNHTIGNVDGLQTELDGKIKYSDTATTQEAQDAVSGKYPDAAGVHAAFNQFGLGLDGSLPRTRITDCNAATTSGLFQTTVDALNKPVADSGYLFVESWEASTVLKSQTFTSAVENRRWFRTIAGDGIWKSWVEVFHTGNVATTNENQVGSRNDVPTTPKGVHEAFNQYGIADYVVAVTDDADNYRTPGTAVWLNGASTNKPIADSGLLETKTGANAGTIWQLFTASAINTGEVFRQFFRQTEASNQTWNDWQEVFHSGNVATTTENQNATRNDVPTTPQGIKEYVDQFGIGGDVGQLLPTSDLDSASNETGTYIYLSSHTGAPSAANGQVWLSKTTSPSTEGQAQIAVDRNGKMFFRIFTALPASAWTEVADVNDIVTYTAGSGIQLVGSEFSLSDETYTTTEKNKLADLENVNLTGGTNVSISGVYPDLTIDATDTDTTYSAGNGISLSGTTFSVAAGDGLTQEASGLAVDATVVRDSDIGTNAERDVLIQTSEPTSGQGADGDICYVYTP